MYVTLYQAYGVYKDKICIYFFYFCVSTVQIVSHAIRQFWGCYQEQQVIPQGISNSFSKYLFPTISNATEYNLINLAVSIVAQLDSLEFSLKVPLVHLSEIYLYSFLVYRLLTLAQVLSSNIGAFDETIFNILVGTVLNFVIIPAGVWKKETVDFSS